MPWIQTGATHYYSYLGLSDKSRAIKELVVCNNWDLEPLDLINGLAVGKIAANITAYHNISKLIFRSIIAF